MMSRVRQLTLVWTKRQEKFDEAVASQLHQSTHRNMDLPELHRLF